MYRALIAFSVAAVLCGTIIMSCAPQQKVNVQPDKPNGKSEVDTTLVKMYLSLGWDNYRNKQYDRAIEQFRKVLELDPQNEKTYKFMSDCCLHHPDTTFIDTALALYEDAIKKFPKTSYFYSGLGYVYKKMVVSLKEEANSIADSVMSEQLMSLADEYDDKAIENFMKAVQLNDKDASSTSSIGTIWLRRGKLDSALVWFEISAKIDSNQTGVWEFLAKIYEARNLNKKAAVAYKNLNRLEPDIPEYLLKMGQYLAKSGDFQKATEILQKYIDSDPDDFRGYQYMGLALAADNKNQQALEKFKKAEELNPGSVKLMCDIAATYKDMKKYSTAEKYIGKAKKIDAKYGYIYIVEGDIVQQKAMDQVPASGELNMEIKCEFLKATRIYRNALRDPDWAGFSKNKMDYLKPYIPTKEEIAAYKFIEGKVCGE